MMMRAIIWCSPLAGAASFFLTMLILTLTCR